VEVIFGEKKQFSGRVLKKEEEVSRFEVDSKATFLPFTIFQMPGTNSNQRTRKWVGAGISFS